MPSSRRRPTVLVVVSNPFVPPVMLQEGMVEMLVVDSSSARVTVIDENNNEPCACQSRDGLVVHRSSFVCRDETSILGHQVFRLPESSRGAARLALNFLLARVRTTYACQIKNGSLCRTLECAADVLFSKSKKKNDKCGCIEYVWNDRRDAVFHLENTVVFVPPADEDGKKGLTVESVVLSS